MNETQILGAFLIIAPIVLGLWLVKRFDESLFEVILAIVIIVALIVSIAVGVTLLVTS